MATDTWTLDVDARLDYAFDWTAWLGGDVIIGAIITAPGLTAEPATIDDGRVVVWLSGGSPGTHRVSCRITTAAGRVDERTKTIYVTER